MAVNILKGFVRRFQEDKSRVRASYSYLFWSASRQSYNTRINRVQNLIPRNLHQERETTIKFDINIV